MAASKLPEVAYPQQRWRKLSKRTMCFHSGFGPSGVDIWLVDRDGDLHHYTNWSGSPGGVDALKRQGYVAWCYAEPPLAPKLPKDRA